MSSQRPSRKRRRQRGGPGRSGDSAASGSAPAATTASPSSATADPSSAPEPAAQADAFERRYARSRAKDDAVRASLKPLSSGERPLAVTIGAIVAALLALANAIALAFGYNTDDGTSMLTRTIVVTALLAFVAWGMWQSKYWAVLGMHTLLALMIIFAALALVTAVNVWAAILMVLLIGGSGTLFWFLVKAMARIQMPPRPGDSR